MAPQEQQMQGQQKRGFLSRLAGNQTGNVLLLVAAALLPILALIGAGVDMSRAYMVKSRLQQACDASALAGRRVMTTSSMTASDIAEARKFFDFNFPQKSLGTTSFTPSIGSKVGETTTVSVSASTTLSTVVMKLFGYNSIPITVSCEAKFDIGNIDAMFVLDTTGSMDDPIDGVKKIQSLKDAVKDFYDVLSLSAASTGRIRYGFVPYSSTVNVGYLLPSSYILGGTSGETVPYQSREFETYVSNGSGNGVNSTCYRRYGLSNCYSTSFDANNALTSSTLSGPNCSAYGINNYPTTGSNPSVSGTAPSNVVTTTYSFDSYNGSTSASNSGSARKCVRKEVINTKTYATRWVYKVVNQNVTQYITGASVANPAYNSALPNATVKDDWGNDATVAVNSTSTWAGCIEERATDNTITSSSSLTIPSTAYDLQIDTVPSSTATKWRPHWPEVMFSRSSTATAYSGYWMNSSTRKSGGYMACPTKARKLTSYSSRTVVPTGQPSSFDDYVNSLTPIGGTYHDIGMVWGARLLSATGIFASENATAPNGFQINRNIIFMTDGIMSAYDNVYDAWGYQLLDGRIAATNSSNTTLTDIHNRRLEMICAAVKAQGVTIWVVAFGTTVTSQLNSCGTSSNHVKTAANRTELITKFREIAQNIGGLRLTQ